MSATDSIASNCREGIRSRPLPSMGGALAAGFILSRLPILGILGLVLRISLALVRPALLVLGGAKAWDLIQQRRENVSPDDLQQQVTHKSPSRPPRAASRRSTAV